MTETPVTTPPLKRSLGLVDVALFFAISGSNLQWVATAAAAGPSSLVVWVIGAFAMFVPLSIVVVYLSSHYPEEGGMYVWTKRAFGPFAGYITGWTYWSSNLPYFPSLLYFAAGNALFVMGATTTGNANLPVYFILFALAGLAVGTILNILGLDVAKWLNNIGAVARWTVTLVLIGLGIWAWAKFGPASPMNAATLKPSLHFSDIVFWSTIAFAWTGPESLPFMAGEIRNPRRAIPFGLLIAAPTIAIIYILGTGSVLSILPAAHVDASSGVMQAIGHAALQAGWSIIVPACAVMVAISCLGSCGAWLGSVARIPFVAGIDRYLPPVFGRMHPKYGSPVAALLTQSGIAAIFIFLGQAGTSVKGAYQTLVDTTVLITMIPFVFLFLSAIKLKGSDVGTVRVPGGRATVVISGIVGLITTIAAMALSLISAAQGTPHDALLAVVKVVGMTAAVVGAGVIFYAIASASRRSAT
jgi:amino acid transporter